jgi:beta-galactosidase
MLKKGFSWITVLVIFCQLTALAQTRTRYAINESWWFKKGEVPLGEYPSTPITDWEKVNLPHSWNTSDVEDELRGYYMGAGWYRKNLTIAPELKGKKLFLYFEGAGHTADVFVNGKFVGRHLGGYTAFCFDITAQVNFDQKTQLIAARIDNANNADLAPLSADFTFYGGIYRDVWLIATEAVHFDMLNYASSGIFVETPQVSETAATVKVRGAFLNETKQSKKLTVVSQIVEKNGNIVTTLNSAVTAKAGEKVNFTQNTTKPIANPKLWSPESPNLYYVITQIKEGDKILDEVRNPLGFRWWKFDADKGFFLNGNPLKLVGANRHQDFLNMGNALSDNQHRQDMKLMKEMGSNFIRISHYPQDPAILQACDELGIIAWEESPLVNRITMSEGFFHNSKEMHKEMIRQHYNHPSVLMWGYMNEIFLHLPHQQEDTTRFNPYARELVRLAKELHQLSKQEDPYRNTVIAFHLSQLYNEWGLGDITDIVGWNLYFGWYHDDLSVFGKYMDEEKKKYPKRVHFISEYGAGSDERIHSFVPEPFDFSAEWQRRYHESYNAQIMERPYIAGMSIWNFVNFNSESRGDSKPRINQKGMLNQDRTYKDVFYYYKAAWNKTTPVLHIASQEWKIRTGTAGSNNTKQIVEVYTNLPEVELFCNGISLGKKKPNNFRVDFEVPFTNGRNNLLAQAISEGKIIADVCDIDFIMQPQNAKEITHLGMNLGSPSYIIDHQSNFIFEGEKAYTTGSYGYVGGEAARKWGKKPNGTLNDILNTSLDPLYQSYREGIESVKFDVADGEYEISLYMVEPITKKEREQMINNLAKEEVSKTENTINRIFDIIVNGQVVLPNFNLAEQCGEEQAVIKKIRTNATEGKGIEVQLKAKSGKTILSAIEIYKVF